VNGTASENLDFVRRWGQVHVELPEKRVLDAKQANLKSLSNAVREFGEAAVKFLAIKGTHIPGTLRDEHGFDPELATLFTADEYLEILNTMQTPQNDGSLWRRKFEQHLDALMTALRLLEPFVEALRNAPRPETETPPDLSIPEDLSTPAFLKRT
jgi:hypothetical protein